LRSTAIEDRLVQLLTNELHVRVEIAGPLHWQSFATEPRYRFGYAPPTRTPGEPVTVTLSPKTIDAVTAHLTDDELDLYLMAVESFLAWHLMSPELPSDEVMRLLEDELLATAPACLRLMSATELRAIDSGIVASL
jgi:hypothetical protein